MSTPHTSQRMSTSQATSKRRASISPQPPRRTRFGSQHRSAGRVHIDPTPFLTSTTYTKRPSSRKVPTRTHNQQQLEIGPVSFLNPTTTTFATTRGASTLAPPAFMVMRRDSDVHPPAAAGGKRRHRRSNVLLVGC